MNIQLNTSARYTAEAAERTGQSERKVHLDAKHGRAATRSEPPLQIANLTI